MGVLVGVPVEYDPQDHDSQRRQTKGMPAQELLSLPVVLHATTLFDFEMGQEQTSLHVTSAAKPVLMPE